MRLIKKPEVPKVILLQRWFQEDNFKKANNVSRRIQCTETQFFLQVLPFKKKMEMAVQNFFICVSNFEKF